jgi:hypothetical protein
MALTDEIDQGCEHCGKDFPIEDCHMMEDIWICDGCYREWKAIFDTCNHEWDSHTNQYGEPARYCHRCCGVETL